MRILFLSKHTWPHVGGVEKHIQEITNNLVSKGHKVETISEKNINYPHIRILGLLYIWFWLFKNRKKILGSDIVHIHDVFIWYLPFRFLFPKKKVYITFHGWEGKYPLPIWNIFNKRMANSLCSGSIAVGKYIEKWYGIKSDVVVYGGVERTPGFKNSGTQNKIKNSIVYLGRLEKDTGVEECIRSLVHGYKNYRIDFVGDGALRNECEKYGKVHGFTDPASFLQKAEFCVPSGYLSYLEAKSYGCKIMTFADNPLKKDYWNEIKKVKNFPTWEELTDIYLRLWKN